MPCVIKIFPSDMSKGVFLLSIAKDSWQVISRLWAAQTDLQRELTGVTGKKLMITQESAFQREKACWECSFFIKKKSRALHFPWINIFINIVYFLFSPIGTYRLDCLLSADLTAFGDRWECILNSTRPGLCQSCSPLSYTPFDIWEVLN